MKGETIKVEKRNWHVDLLSFALGIACVIAGFTMGIISVMAYILISE